ncbi:hypothetical protein EXW94_17990 [Enterobacter sp. JMULE2]|uniref:Uncharacterized protein n=1 Tax=Enterobacter mori TaxID=539813 RepID=A0A9Q7NUM9_9ENTR|nr:hypothetical protein [Enterobacter sp. JMULE2]RTQ26395.1 hypothetical protein EKN29_04450 [Enterobacter mori]
MPPSLLSGGCSHPTIFPFLPIIDLFRVTSFALALIIKAVALMGVISYGTAACRTEPSAWRDVEPGRVCE